MQWKKLWNRQKIDFIKKYVPICKTGGGILKAAEAHPY
jgi:hypothetical protein